MERSFRLAFSNRGICIAVLEVALLCLYGYVVLRMDSWVRVAIFMIFLLMALVSFMAYFKSKYVINDHEIVVDFYSDEKRSYQIDKINKIVYVDTSSKWRPFSKKARYQLAIYFERSYLKSVEPRTFFPANRDSFVDAILEINPDIIIEKTDIKFKPFQIG